MSTLNGKGRRRDTRSTYRVVTRQASARDSGDSDRGCRRANPVKDQLYNKNNYKSLYPAPVVDRRTGTVCE